MAAVSPQCNNSRTLCALLFLDIMANHPMLSDKTLDDIIEERRTTRIAPTPDYVSPLESPAASPRGDIMALSPFAKASGSGSASGKPPRPPKAPAIPAPDTPAPPAPPTVSALIGRLAHEANISLKGPLTPDLRTFLKKHGICFYCRIGVHLREDCPKRTTAKPPKRPREDIPLLQQFKLAVRAEQQQQQQQQ